MNWKVRQRHLAEMRWKKRGHNRIEIPPVPKPVKVLKVCNPIQAILQKFRTVDKGVKPKTVCLGPVIIAQNRWGEAITIPKTSVFKCPFNFIYALEKRGFKRLGAGAYSTVLGKEGSNKVIKVSRSLDNWIDYIQWGAANGYAGNFAPRVYSWKRHPGSEPLRDWESNNDWSVAVVERMADTVTEPEQDMYLLMNLYYPAYRGNMMAKLYMDDLCPGSYKFFNGLQENNFASDIAGKNVMVRKDGSFCVTDPTCGSIKTEKKRFRTGDLSPSVLRIANETCMCYKSRSWYDRCTDWYKTYLCWLRIRQCSQSPRLGLV